MSNTKNTNRYMRIESPFHDGRRIEIRVHDKKVQIRTVSNAIVGPYVPIYSQPLIDAVMLDAIGVDKE